MRRGEARVDGVFVDAGAAVLRDGADDEDNAVNIIIATVMGVIAFAE